ncbi:hypothetical protein HG530_004506 [Fusarium avenaceum]|nr:hypothetical protein HG530_004506 [Fusarium avenaceum]
MARTRPKSTRESCIDVDLVTIRSPHASFQNTLEVITSTVAESRCQRLISPPVRREYHGVLVVVRLHHAFEPCVSSSNVVQTARFIIPAEHLPVLSQLCVDIPIHQTSLGRVTKGIHDQARFDERPPARANFPFREGHLKVLANLFQEFALQLSHPSAQRRDLFNAAITVEVFHELKNSLQKTRALPVLARLGQAPELLIRRRQHLQALKSRHAQREVALGPIESLYVGRHRRDILFGFNCA